MVAPPSEEGGGGSREPDSSHLGPNQGTCYGGRSVSLQATICSARGARYMSVAGWVLAALLGVASRTLECRAGVDSWGGGQWVIAVPFVIVLPARDLSDCLQCARSGRHVVLPEASGLPLGAIMAP